MLKILSSFGKVIVYQIATHVCKVVEIEGAGQSASQRVMSGI